MCVYKNSNHVINTNTPFYTFQQLKQQQKSLFFFSKTVGKGLKNEIKVYLIGEVK